MTHTFLFEPGVWTASGTFWRGDGEPMEAQGRTEITHRNDCWLLSSTLKVLGSPPVEFVNAYCIELFPPLAPACSASICVRIRVITVPSTWNNLIPTPIAARGFSCWRIAR